jgi:hypothetical protein
MNKAELRTMGALVLVALASEVPLSYAECEAPLDAGAVGARYEVKGDQVYDKKTNLTWQRCSVGQKWSEGSGCTGDAAKMSHDRAHQSAADGWRMPGVSEMMSIVRKDCKNPAIDPQLFPNTPADVFHSAVKRGLKCFGVDFSNGSEYSSGRRNNLCDYSTYVRLVKTGQ